jgi:S-DNA-T family DNA segregation ATPase FtsK/SpoIIIE
MAKRNNQVSRKEQILQHRRFNEIHALFLFLLAALVLISLISYDPRDVHFNTSFVQRPAHNYIGVFGAYLAYGLLFLVGYSAYLVPFLIFIQAVAKLSERLSQRIFFKIVGIAVLFLSSSALLSLIFSLRSGLRFATGGVVGLYVSDFLLSIFGQVGAYIILILLSLLSIALASDILVFQLLALLWRLVKFFAKKIVGLFFVKIGAGELTSRSLSRRAVEPGGLKIKPEKLEKEIPLAARPQVKISPLDTFFQDEARTSQPLITKVATKKPEPQIAARVAVQKRQDTGDYKLPALDLLASPPPIQEREIKDDLENNSRVLEGTLRDFGIEARVMEVERGPAITRYEIEPAPGVKVSRIVELSDDIALVMKAPSVRIVAPIPGKARVGVEVPNTVRSVVYLRDILESSEFQQARSKITLALGKDIAGDSVIADLDEMPHLLIAGTTGSGKTVCVNSLIMSILFNATPEEVKFLMVDPKMVELAIFNNLPHLLCPVVTEAKKVSGALAWVVSEMEERYRILARVGVRNIEIFNEKIEKNEIKFAPEELNGRPLAKMPYIVVIIDELADLMVAAPQEVETAITRLAQLSRAVGIHMILATQRPSVDVITGVIKANFPARISFKVASKVDSRTVLDMNGADKLLGQGDFLFLKPGLAKPIRAQGSLVSDKEIEKVVEFIKAQRSPAYDEEIMEAQERRGAFKGVARDELLDEAIKLVLQTKQASVSMLQRKLGLGYTRAARLIDMMEEEGVVGPYRGSKAREILIESYEKIKQEEQPAP